jgi:hypothetical protein
VGREWSYAPRAICCSESGGWRACVLALLRSTPTIFSSLQAWLAGFLSCCTKNRGHVVLQL